ncbi:nucleotidyl transferase AbiEii/AbiGii toxin family protein [Loigolactobacillus jiayinensis]|uniref:Nucleotidyl transferase AbiEii/AbiGii toxin family protein n=1 Tax=Loigolactobacillus jiayinensis TaxID=2486016 RepID=A0ABW1RDC2_9LACO|nr:nucleotidyl transferase AbiEii/AbiGii toxin family protein [Loigolactobacillus jiayinensis]
MKDNFSNPMQFKSFIKKSAQRNQVTPQLFLQEVVLDNLLEKISVSKYRDNLILKGGFLIASIIGVDTRSTMDMDTTIVGLPLDGQRLFEVFSEICQQSLLNDIIKLVPTKIEPIRKDDEYGGYRLHIDAQIYTLRPTIKVDISTGDKITPAAIVYRHKLLTENRTIDVMSYNLETIVAEKMETIIARGINNTRPKDFYDAYAFDKLEFNNLDFSLLRQALANTASHRGTVELLADYQQVIIEIETDEQMKQRWRNYQRTKPYANDIDFSATCRALKELYQKVN